MVQKVVDDEQEEHAFRDDLGLAIIGLGVQYPPQRHGPEALEVLARRHYKSSPALEKVLSINRLTGIDFHASVGALDHPLINGPRPPTITELDELFRVDGVDLAVKACAQALAEAGVAAEQVTHLVATTCTNSANPGYDHHVRKRLGIRPGIERILLHGVGCSGGAAAMRVAANLALAASYQRRPARVLVVACELSSLLVRSELHSICEKQEVRIGPCLFSDCASACVISNGLGSHGARQQAIFEIRGWRHEIIEDTESLLGFDIDPMGWKVVLKPQVPVLASAAVRPAFVALRQSVKSVPETAEANEFAWALHPGGITIISGVQAALKLPDQALLSSFEVYRQYGNSSSATILSVMHHLRQSSGKPDVMACAFGPGITLEMMMLRRMDGGVIVDKRQEHEHKHQQAGRSDGNPDPLPLNGHSSDQPISQHNGHENGVAFSNNSSMAAIPLANGDKALHEIKVTDLDSLTVEDVD